MTDLRASKDMLPVPYGSSFSSKVLPVKDFLMLLLEVLLLKEDLESQVNAEQYFVTSVKTGSLFWIHC